MKKTFLSAVLMFVAFGCWSTEVPRTYFHLTRLDHDYNSNGFEKVTTSEPTYEYDLAHNVKSISYSIVCKGNGTAVCAPSCSVAPGSSGGTTGSGLLPMALYPLIDNVYAIAVSQYENGQFSGLTGQNISIAGSGIIYRTEVSWNVISNAAVFDIVVWQL